MQAAVARLVMVDRQRCVRGASRVTRKDASVRSAPRPVVFQLPRLSLDVPDRLPPPQAEAQGSLREVPLAQMTEPDTTYENYSNRSPWACIVLLAPEGLWSDDRR